MRLSDLRHMCADRSLDTSGRKAALVQRLLQADEDNHADREVVYDHRIRPNEDESASEGTDNENDVLSDDEGEVRLIDPQMSEALKLKQLELQIEQTRLEQLKLRNGTLSPGLGPSYNSAKPRDLPLPTMGENSDPLAFFSCWEKTLKLNGIEDESLYAKLLPSHLNERAKRVFAGLPFDQCLDYTVVKDQIIASFRASAGNYLEKFRGMKRAGNENQKMFVARLSEAYGYYIQAGDIKTFEDLKKASILEQFLGTLDPATKQFVCNNRPTDAGEAAKLADTFFENSRACKGGASNLAKSKMGAKDGKMKQADSLTSGQSQTEAAKQKNACFICNDVTHLKASCPMRHQAQSKTSSQKSRTQPGFVKDKKKSRPLSKFEIPISVENQNLIAYRDTGSNMSFVQAQLFPNIKVSGKIEIFGINDKDPISVPTATVTVKAPILGQDEVRLEVGLLKHLHWQFLLGNNAFEENNLKDILRVDVQSARGDDIGMTKTNETADDSAALSELETPVGHPGELIQLTGARAPSDESDYSVTDLTTDTAQHGDVMETRALNQSQTQTGPTDMTADMGSNAQHVFGVSRVNDSTNGQSVDGDGSERTTPHETNVNAAGDTDDGDSLNDEFIRLSGMGSDKPETVETDTTRNEAEKFKSAQVNDQTLAHWWSLAKGGSKTFITADGMLWKRKPPNIASDNEFLLCLPESYRDKVLKTAHDSLHAGGHTSHRRTLMKIRRTFAFPREFTAVKNYCKSCEVCARKTARHPKDKVEIHPIPVVGEFGETWCCDVLGPSFSPTARRKNRYVLVCVDAATRYTQLFALRNLKAETLTDVFVNQLFPRFGTPKNLTYDLQSALTSQLFQTTLKALSVDSKISLAGYHTRTGLAERQVRSVSDILKAYIHEPEHRKNWDTILNHLAFNINQLPCKTLGFSAHELIFGRNLRSELEVLRDEFLGLDECQKSIKRNVIAFMTDLQNRLHTANELAKQHAMQEQQKTCTWYNKNTKPKTFKPGDFCIVLVADDDRKLFARWSEPRKIIRRVSETSYETQLDNDRTEVKHVNCLRPFTPRAQAAAVVVADTTENAEDQLLPLIDWGGAGAEPSQSALRIGTHLTERQQAEMRTMLNSFPDVLTEKLGVSDVLTHKIELTDDTPCVSRPYKIPHSLEKPVQQEIDRLLDLGVISESTSDYCAPMVPVRKKGSDEIRITVNFSRINAKMRDIKFPMTNPTILLGKVAGKPFVSSCDLSKSFYQLRLHEDSRRFTAFWAGNCSYEFNRVPMGIKTAPAILQKLMTKVLRGTEDFTSSLLDDIVIFSDTWEEHVKHVKQVMERLREAALTLNVAKCQFCLKSMNILGYTLMDGKLMPSDDKVEAIMKLAPAKTKKGVKAILGLAGYYRNLQPNFAETTYCLNELLKKNQPEKVRWQEKHSKALDTIKQNLTRKPVLTGPQFDREFLIFSDATQKTIAAILSQKDNDGCEKVIAYASRSLLEREQKFSSIERECLAVIWSLQKWEQWLWNQKIRVITDHQPLQYLSRNLTSKNARLLRWHLFLQAWDITTQYRRGCDHGNADALSRLETD